MLLSVNIQELLDTESVKMFPPDSGWLRFSRQKNNFPERAKNKKDIFWVDGANQKLGSFWGKQIEKVESKAGCHLVKELA